MILNRKCQSHTGKYKVAGCCTIEFRCRTGKNADHTADPRITSCTGKTSKNRFSSVRIVILPNLLYYFTQINGNAVSGMLNSTGFGINITINYSINKPLCKFAILFLRLSVSFFKKPLLLLCVIKAANWCFQASFVRFT